MLGQGNPLAAWEEVFDGADVSGDISRYPPFDEVLARCREVRESTLALLDELSEDDLDRVSAKVPEGFEDTAGIPIRDEIELELPHANWPDFVERYAWRG